MSTAAGLYIRDVKSVTRAGFAVGSLFVLALALLAGLSSPSDASAQGSISGSAQGSAAPSSSAVSPAAPPPKTGPQRVDAVEAELIADRARIVPGQPFRLALRLAHDHEWHTYWRNPGDSGLPTQFEPHGPAGTAFGPIAWPAPQRIAIGPLANYGYEGEIALSREARLPAAYAGSTVRFEVLAQWLVCRHVCVPGEAALALELPVGAAPAAATAAATAAAATAAAAPGTGRHAALIADALANAPDPAAARTAGWWRAGDDASLVLPSGLTPARAEFFPYFEGVVSPAAAQRLTEGEHGRVLRLALLAGADDRLPDAAAGLLVADGRAIELRLAESTAAPMIGRELAVAEAVKANIATPANATGVGGGLLERLRGGGASGGGMSIASPSVQGGGAGGVVGGGGGAAAAAGGVSSSAVSATLGYALIAALIGGLILNLMPCVFPVIGLKLVSFATAARGDPRVARRHAFVFGAGVVATFLVLGCALLLLRAVGDSVGWGFQLQSPTFVAALALLFVLIGLNFFGVFEAGLGLTRFGGTGPMPAGSDDGGGRQSAAASFWTGVIAVVAATPCTAPFMGSAIGFTLTSSALETLLVFAAIGVGMALPYLLLGTNGRALRWLPRPGPWLQTFRQLLAFPMFATAAWLAWVLTLQIGADGLLRLLAAAILVALVAWIYGRGQSAPRTRGGLPGYGWLTVAIVATIAALFQLVQIDGLDAVATRTDSLEVSDAGVARDGEAGRGAVASAGVSTSSMAAATHWQAWSASKVAEATRAGRTVFVDFTAAWCISCQANKKLVLERDAVTRAFRDGEVVLLRGDWTRRDPAITAELAQHGRNGVPLYLVYTPGAAAPRVLPELLTSDIVLTAIGAQN